LFASRLNLSYVCPQNPAGCTPRLANAVAQLSRLSDQLRVIEIGFPASRFDGAGELGNNTFAGAAKYAATMRRHQSIDDLAADAKRPLTRMSCWWQSMEAQWASLMAQLWGTAPIRL
jgi:hypothetical protein